MAQHREKLIFCSIGLLRGKLRGLNLASADLVSDIPGDLGKSEKHPFFVVHSGDHHIRLKNGSVLLHTWSLITDVSVLAGQVQKPHRLSVRPVSWRIKPLETFTNDFFNRVP